VGFGVGARVSVPEDEYFHGTHVAGIAAAQSGNGIGGAGMCPDCKILPLRVLNAHGGGKLSTVAAGIYYAIDNGADVINLSLGKEGLNSEILDRAVRDAWQAGIFVVCAADNQGRDVRSYPAAYAECVAVAATTEADRRADFSQYGRWVELAAPGAEIYSTVLNGAYDDSEGTSMAAPHVAGLAGLLSSQGLSNNQIRQKLCESAVPITGTASEWTCGRINALAAVTGEMPPEPQPTPTPTTSPLQPELEGTPTATPTATPTPPPVADLIPNGSYNDLGTSAKLGGENNSTDMIFQDIRVPINGTLTYYWGAMGTDDPNDFLQVEIEVLDGSDTKFAWSHDDKNGNWYPRSTHLGSLAGEIIRIRFSAVTDDRDPRVFYVDNVSLK